MARPPRCRHVEQLPLSDYFKPRGVPLSEVGEVVLSVDELEALRLADLQGNYQEQAARKMNVSRQTFGRIITAARRKTAEALVEGKALRIEGGEFRVPAIRIFECEECGNLWELVRGRGRPRECPQCQSVNIHRADHDGRRRANGGAGHALRGGFQPKSSPRSERAVKPSSRIG